MASAGTPSSSSGRRKSLDAEVNLVPFIDLLSMCICFLLMTAVWMEIGSLQVKQLVGTEAPSPGIPSYEMDLKYTASNMLEMDLKFPGKKIEKFNVQGSTADERVAALSTILGGLTNFLRLNPALDLKTQLGKIITIARVTTKTGIPYGELVGVMDALRDHGIVNLGVVPVRE